MATITPALVREVIKTELTDDEISGVITTSNVLYSTLLANKGFGDGLEIEIKRYLTAHFVAVKDPTPTVKAVGLGDAREEYEQIGNVTVQTGLKATRWGQTAITLDPSGTLIRVGGVKQTLRVL